MKRHHIAAAAAVVALGASGLTTMGVAGATERPAAAATTKPTALWSCTNRPVVKPRSFVITCADGYTLLTATHWTSWTAASATGTTTFAMNLCDPYCAASKISYFPGSTVRLSAPEQTKHGRLFSKLTVTYKIHGKTKTFPFSWTGDPSFRR